MRSIAFRSARAGTTTAVLEVLNDDMPFLVDSVIAALKRHDLTVELLAHPDGAVGGAAGITRQPLGTWRIGTHINLERSLRVGDELGGHLVSGHVDGVGTALSATPENASTRWRFQVPSDLARFIAAKGSVAIDGVSLTVNDVAADTFGVNIIPHTAAVTLFGTMKPGDDVNIEIDMLARYVARLAETT